ncbi:hypothetical protein GCM10010106_33620 [Thermopolyspora flexuosa]|nr:hypothetical protein GCM10010106_33620 [Thermopolyspora flexuosa]
MAVMSWAVNEPLSSPPSRTTAHQANGVTAIQANQADTFGRPLRGVTITPPTADRDSVTSTLPCSTPGLPFPDPFPDPLPGVTPGHPGDRLYLGVT